ncbi:hypothetical protein ONS95_013459 [Cadophora gregata]|uniref:uncharacterized protein n=1 Tax=Cadophora gregata TaxID=51156 RepID=UPI0026DC606F|nr:uncharacterized protein ONS95_013459 [Cadophora gregata]KAK0099645.1 hypothetical protein ONS96_008144 [Cadophora gregata f. sp. sojae]KAK0116444.1 hypothetical protein ONS95_013459 [Cadophora gregata]
MQLLLHHGLSTCATNSNGRTALHEASSQGNVDALELLLAQNQDLISCKTPEGWTALHCAIDPFLHWKVDIAVVLLANGADINAITKDGRTVLQLAIARNHYDSILFISYLLDNGADITAIYNEGRVDDSYAVSKDPASMVLQEARVVGQVGDSLLHLAVDTQRINLESINTLRLLLDRGLDLESRDIQGRTPVLRPADYGRE